MRRIVVGEAIRAVWCLHIDPVLVVERNLNERFGTSRLRHGDYVDLFVGVALWVD